MIVGSNDNVCVAITCGKELVVFLNQQLYPALNAKQLPSDITSVAFSADRRILFVGTSDGSLVGLTIDYDNSQEKKNIEQFCLAKHTVPIKHIACAPNGSYIISIDQNNVIYKWNKTHQCEKNLFFLFQEKYP